MPAHVGACTASTATRTALKDPYNPVDAIFAAARYLRAAGADTRPARRDLRLQPRRLVRRLGDPARALHRRPAGRPRRLALRPHAGPLPGPGQGGLRQGGPAQGRQGGRGAARTPRTSSSPARERKGIKIFASRGAPVVAVNDGRIVKVGHSRRLGTFVTLQDVYGNTYTYAHLKDVVEKFPTPKPRTVDEDAGRARAAAADARRRARPARRRSTTEAEAKARAGRAKARAPRRSRAAPRAPRRPPRSACSPTPTARTPRRPAASSRPTSAPRTSAATSTASSASTAPTST